MWDFSQTIRQSEIRRLTEEHELERQAEIQAERDMIQNTMWSKSILKFQGKLKGTPCDPLPGEDIPYSVLMQLLEEKRVQYVDYGEFGQYVAGLFYHLKLFLLVLLQYFGGFHCCSVVRKLFVLKFLPILLESKQRDLLRVA